MQKIIIVLFFVFCSQSVLAQDKLRHHYKLDGNGNEELGNPSLILNGGISATTDRHGNPSGAMGFDGVDDFLSLSSAITFGLNDFTLEAWVNFDANIATEQLTPIFAGNDPNRAILEYRPVDYVQNSSFNFWQHNSEGVHASGWYGWGSIFSDYRESEWHHIAVSVNQKTLQVTFYIDGEPKGKRDLDSNGFTTSPLLFLGKHASRYFKGAMDDVKIWDRPLPTSEIWHHAHPESATYEGSSSVILHLGLNGGELVESGDIDVKIQNGPRIATDRFGDPAGAMLFDGIDDHIQLRQLDMFYQSSFSLEAWFALDSDAVENDYYPIFGNSQNTPALGYYPKHGQLTGLQQFDGGSIYLGWTTHNDIRGNGWHHVVMTVDQVENLAELFFDGESYGKVPVDPKGFNHGNGALTQIGKDYASFFKGALDNVIIYDGVLPEAEILEHYNAKPGNNIVFWEKEENSENIYFNSESGAVAIGTDDFNTEGYKLYVNGKLLTEEVMIAQKGSVSWPDYVFHKDYELRSLEELEAFIKANKHLPNIPSAQKVTAQGSVGMGEMNKKLLEKVEELTLYLIQQNKQIQEMKAELEKLKQHQKANK